MGLARKLRDELFWFSMIRKQCYQLSLFLSATFIKVKAKTEAVLMSAFLNCQNELENFSGVYKDHSWCSRQIWNIDQSEPLRHFIVVRKLILNSNAFFAFWALGSTRSTWADVSPTHDVWLTIVAARWHNKLVAKNHQLLRNKNLPPCTQKRNDSFSLQMMSSTCVF